MQLKTEMLDETESLWSKSGLTNDGRFTASSDDVDKPETNEHDFTAN